jgi:hypothetical protein
MAVEFQDIIFLVVTTCSVAVGYQSFAGLCSCHPQDEMKTEAARTLETLVSYRNTTLRHN